MAKKRRKSRKGGTGSVITMRRLKGVGALNRPASFAGAFLPPLIGGGVTGIALLATRYWAKPSEGQTPRMLFKYAPAVGFGAGALASIAMYWFAGAPAMLSSMASSLITAAIPMAQDMMLKTRLGEYQLALADVNGNGGGDTAGLGVIVPQRISGGTGAIMFQPTSQVDPYQRYGVSGLGSNDMFGQTVSLQGTGSAIQASAFGRSSIR